MGNKFLGTIDPNTILRGDVEANPGDTFVAESIDHKRCAACVYEPGCRESVGGWGNFRLLHVGLRSKCLDIAENFHTAQAREIATEDGHTQKSHKPRF